MSTYAVVTKVDVGERLVFGWAYVAKEKDGSRVVDHSGEWIDPDDLEPAVYRFVEESREANDMHTDEVRGTLVESMFFSPEKLQTLGLPRDALPTGHFVGFRVDEDTMRKVKTGDRMMFSYQGAAQRV